MNVDCRGKVWCYVICYSHAVSTKNVLSTSQPLLVTICANVRELPLVCEVCVVHPGDWEHLYKLVYVCALGSS